MSVFERNDKPNLGARAELHDYSGSGKVLISVELSVAQKMLELAVDKGGSAIAQVVFDGKSYNCELVGARIASFDEFSKPLGKPNLVGFGSLTKRK